MKSVRTLAAIAGAAALLTILTASKCEQHTEFVPYVDEICGDAIDNDEDRKTDCDDSNCNAVCRVSVTINAPPATIKTDSLIISGTQANATGSISISVRPSGTSNPGVISGGNWVANLSLLSARTTYTVTAIASGAQDRKDTATVTFQRID